MNENMRPVDSIKEGVRVRSEIYNGIREAIHRVALKYNMGEVNAGVALQAVEDALAGDIDSVDPKVLREKAEEAAEKVLTSYGFDNAEFLADLWLAIDKKLPESAER